MHILEILKLQTHRKFFQSRFHQSLWPLSAPRLRSPELSISRRRKTRSKCICIPAPMPHGHGLTDFLYQRDGEIIAFARLI
jgi:hypothetical protein